MYRKNNRVFILAVVFLLGIISGKIIAAENNRLVLALYDSKEESLVESNIHQFIEMPLNRLGLIVEYHDINERPFPNPKKYHGVVTWFGGDVITDIGQYYRWLETVLDAGVKLVLLNGLGVVEDESGAIIELELYNNVLEKLGILKGKNGDLGNPFVVSYEKTFNDNFNFEVDEATNNPVYRDYRIINGRAQSWMNITRSDVADSEAVVVAVGEAGSFISDIGLVVQYVELPVWGILWDLNPFEFFSAAFDVEKTLKPDVTTAFGLRAAFMHIDGDGSSNMTQDIPGVSQPCTKVLQEKVLNKYHFPISVGVIGYRLTPEGGLGEQFVEQLRSILRLPYVQLASHTYTHPMYWADRNSSSLKVPGYNDVGYDPVIETAGAVGMVGEFISQKDKKSELLLWSGDCRATEEALAALSAKGYYNMNGGNSRMDSLYNGIAHISPLSVPVGKYRQYYAPAGNEYLYTDSWTTNYGGFSKVIDTFKNTAAKRYIPVNVYYHLYVAERQAGVNSILRVYNWCRGQELCWLQATEYVKSVIGFLSAKTGWAESGGYFIEDYAGLKTVRLDNDARFVDMSRSTNVLGFTHYGGALYISVVPAARADIVLTDNKYTGLYIAKSTGAVKSFDRQEQSLKASVRLYEAGFIEFAGVEGDLEVLIDGKLVAPAAAGSKRYVLPVGVGEWVSVAVRVVAP